jgi:small subunit ribosomal protein S6
MRAQGHPATAGNVTSHRRRTSFRRRRHALRFACTLRRLVECPFTLPQGDLSPLLQHPKLGPRRPQEVIAINKYELMLIVNPNADEERQKEIVERLRTTIEKDKGTIAGVDEWGKKKLAYEIKKEPEGVYTVITFAATPATLTEVERVLGITDEVLRFMTVRLKS